MNVLAFDFPQKPVEGKEEIILNNDSLNHFINQEKCQVVVKDFKTGKIACYSCDNNPSYSDILDVAYPYFEQMKKRSSCPQGSWIELEGSTLIKGCVFFDQKGIINVETAKKFNHFQHGESSK